VTALDADAILDDWILANESELIAVRRDLHAHPEVAYAEKRTTDVVVEWLRLLGLTPAVLPGGAGAICDIGAGPDVIALRADLDALPIPDHKDVSYRSRTPGVCHACGHDAHTAILLGAAAVLARMDLPGRVRLLFQPAEETFPGGARNVIAAGAMNDVSSVYALHCDPRLDTGHVGLRVGPITAACDRVDVHLSGPGGHTGRPHLTADIAYALGRLMTDLPGLLSRRVDPRAAVSLVWGSVQAGNAPNAIPTSGIARGTLRMLDHATWNIAEALVRELIDQLVEPTGAVACVEIQREAVALALGAHAVADTEQSMGGEDFAWYIEHAPGALARLGVRPPGAQVSYDLHQSTFDIDEAALAVGVRLMVHTALAALRSAAS
jgi:amidohydrolase